MTQQLDVRPGLRQRLGAMLAGGQKALNEMIFTSGTRNLLFRLPRTKIDYAAEIGTGLETSVVMAPVGWIARNFPEAPVALFLKTKPGVLERVENPMLDLLECPNDSYSGVSLWMATMLSWCLDGNAYWVKIRSLSGKVVQLWYVPHWLIEPIAPQDGSIFISHYRYRPVNTPLRIETADVVHLRNGLDPANTRKGLSPLRSLFREIFTDIEAESWIASLIRNQAVPGLIVAPKFQDGQVSHADLLATKEYITQQWTADHRGEPMALGGPTELHQFGFDPKSMDLREIRKTVEERVTAIFGIGAIVAGLGAGLDRSTFNNMKEARESAHEDNIIPTQRLQGAELKIQLLPDFVPDPDRYVVGFDNSRVRALQEDATASTERWNVRVKGGGATRGEWRAAEGLEVRSNDDVYLMPVNIVAVPADQVATGQIGTASRSGGESKGIKANDLQRAIIRGLTNDAAVLIDAFAADLERAFDVLGDLAGDQADQLVANGNIQTAAAKHLGDTKDGDPDELIIDRIIRQIDFHSWDANTFGEAYSAHYLRTVEMTGKTIGAVFNLLTDLPDMEARSIVAAGGTRRGLVDVSGDTRRALFRALTEGRSLGEGPPQLARRIRATVPSGPFPNAGSQYRAKLIARTETKFAQNISSLATYDSMDVVTGVMAFDAQAGPTDADCEARNGQTFNTAQARQLTDAEHPNGTLSWAPVTT